ncbi:universal stress protein [Hymenobacter sp. HSC-4F20]|uniref:universal stress protein n=1 Tax=Hymenobacter sp. HSC-4F20 TaxID=2864135 RepID=UPI001C73885F|nr:universal stress protein [Hymenobacter sp. HSC-4F20]MBX0290485.1 universal stress protein [Hymenobacter sp. HSC-4F20]
MFTFHVLTDFSATATNALQYAVVVARHVGGQVRIWHVPPEAAGEHHAYFSPASQELAGPAVVQELTRLAAQVAAEVPCTWELLLTDPISRFTDLLADATGHVLVVGNANPAKSMASARQSTALHLVRHLAQPLLVVPRTFRAGPVPRRIVLDTDRRAVRLPQAAQTIPGLLAQLTHAQHPLLLGHLPSDVDLLLTRSIPEVVGIHVYTGEASPKMEEIATQVRQTGLLEGVAHTVASTRHPSIEQGIRHAAARYRADLLSFVTRPRTYPGEQFLQSVTAGLLAHSHIPVLTISEV